MSRLEDMSCTPSSGIAVIHRSNSSSPFPFWTRCLVVLSLRPIDSSSITASHPRGRQHSLREMIWLAPGCLLRFNVRTLYEYSSSCMVQVTTTPFPLQAEVLSAGFKMIPTNLPVLFVAPAVSKYLLSLKDRK